MPSLELVESKEKGKNKNLNEEGKQGNNNKKILLFLIYSTLFVGSVSLTKISIYFFGVKYDVL